MLRFYKSIEYVVLHNIIIIIIFHFFLLLNNYKHNFLIFSLNIDSETNGIIMLYNIVIVVHEAHNDINKNAYKIIMLDQF